MIQVGKEEKTRTALLFDSHPLKNKRTQHKNTFCSQCEGEYK